MAEETISVNRAPVLTLWGAVVAARLGYSWEEALTLGKAVAGLNAQAKGRSLGIYSQPKAEESAEPGKLEPKGAERSSGVPKKTGLGEDFWVQLVGRPVPVKRVEGGIRAVVKDQPIEPAGVQRYLESKFGEHLAPVQAAMEELAASYSEEDLADFAYGMYERFRPIIPPGKRGWGARGALRLELIRKLVGKSRGSGIGSR